MYHEAGGRPGFSGVQYGDNQVWGWCYSWVPGRAGGNKQAPAPASAAQASTFTSYTCYEKEGAALHGTQYPHAEACQIDPDTYVVGGYNADYKTYKMYTLDRGGNLKGISKFMGATHDLSCDEVKWQWPTAAVSGGYTANNIVMGLCPTLDASSFSAFPLAVQNMCTTYSLC